MNDTAKLQLDWAIDFNVLLMMGAIRLLSALNHFYTIFCGDYGFKAYVLPCKNLMMMIIIIITRDYWLFSSCPKEADGLI